MKCWTEFDDFIIILLESIKQIVTMQFKLNIATFIFLTIAVLLSFTGNCDQSFEFIYPAHTYQADSYGGNAINGNVVWT